MLVGIKWGDHILIGTLVTPPPCWVTGVGFWANSWQRRAKQTLKKITSPFNSLCTNEFVISCMLIHGNVMIVVRLEDDPDLIFLMQVGFTYFPTTWFASNRPAHEVFRCFHSNIYISRNLLPSCSEPLLCWWPLRSYSRCHLSSLHMAPPVAQYCLSQYCCLVLHRVNITFI